MGLGRYGIGTATGLVAATGSANALIWACRCVDKRTVVERLRVNAVVTGTITAAVPYDLAVYFARNFTVVPTTNAIAAILTGQGFKTASVDAPLLGGLWTLNTQAAGMVSTNTSIRTAALKWTASVAGGAGVFYVELAAGGNPTLAEPSMVRAGGVDLSLASAVAALPAGSYWYGDGDTLGFSTVYVHLADDSDPDSKAVGYVEHWLGAVFDQDTHPLVCVSGATGTVIGTQFFGGMANLIDDEEIELAPNEGLVVRAPLAGPATGTFRVNVNMAWLERNG